MKTKNKRKLNIIFHPIGQGAFISERHDDLNIVYDCGVDWGNRGSKNVNALVKNSFARGERIDILFISHFDYDHVSKIPILYSNFNIRKVIIPLLHENEKQFLVEFYTGLGVTQDIINIIENPNTAFPESQIIRVEPWTEENIDVVIDLERLNHIDRIKSGSRIRTKFWEYIPYNLDYDKRSAKFKQLLYKSGFNPGTLKKNFVYSEQSRRKLKKLYSKVKGDINRNSMLVYSGPVSSSNEEAHIYQLSSSNHYISIDQNLLNNRISALYTGDSSMKDYNLANILRGNWNKVLVFQVPHHGDIMSFDNQQITSSKYVCPINFGTYNTYGHPSNNIVSELAMDHQFIAYVTEDPTSIFMINMTYEV